MKALNLSTSFLQNNFTANLTTLVQYLVQLEVNRTISAVQAVQSFTSNSFGAPAYPWLQWKPVFLRPNIRTQPNMWFPYWTPPMAPQFLEPQPMYPEPSFERTFFPESRGDEITFDELETMKSQAEDEATKRLLLFPSISFPANAAFSLKVPSFLSFLKPSTTTTTAMATTTTTVEATSSSTVSTL